MTALYIVATPSQGIIGPSFGIVADETTAHYVFPDGSNGLIGLDDDRIRMVVSELGETPTDPEMWLALATMNIGYFDTTAPVEAADIDAARTAALQQVAIALPPDETTPNVPNAPTTRAELLAWQREMMDQWAQEYPEAAAGDVDDPDADLALKQYLTPPVDSTKPHEWLPLAVADVNCGFCDKPAEDPIHGTDADTITSGSN